MEQQGNDFFERGHPASCYQKNTRMPFHSGLLGLKGLNGLQPAFIVYTDYAKRAKPLFCKKDTVGGQAFHLRTCELER